MKTTVKDLWLQHPTAKFVLWEDDWYCWSRYFNSPDELDSELFNTEFEFNEARDWLEEINEIWITLNWVSLPEKAAAGKTPPAG